MEKTDDLLEASKISLENPGLQILSLPKSKCSNLIVFRHGQTHDNIRRIFSGRRNSTLTKEGIQQAEILYKKLMGEKIDVIITPNLSRCIKTSQIVLKSLINPKVEISNDLLERDYGNLTGKSKTKLFKKDPILTAKYRRGWDFPPPNGESLKMVWENRIEPFCKYLEKRIRQEKVVVAVCCTNNTMRLIRMYFEQLSKEETLILENPLASDYCGYKID
jgi:broad specificity phosphatase PhoE